MVHRTEIPIGYRIKFGERYGTVVSENGVMMHYRWKKGFVPHWHRNSVIICFDDKPPQTYEHLDTTWRLDEPELEIIG